MDSVDPLTLSWKLMIKRHPGRTFAAGTRMSTPKWSRVWNNNITSWIDMDCKTLQKKKLKITTWNVQGAGNRKFKITLKELIRIHKPVILVLVETRLSGRQADKVCATIGFDGIVRVEAVGFCGGYLGSMEEGLGESEVYCNSPSSGDLRDKRGAPELFVESERGEFQTLVANGRLQRNR
ncbi:hypothetical protein V2J09_023232 [Rumex salicifolius]